ncbi:MAG: type II secretion system protein G, partial [Betaproteobacteria bacterium]
FTSVERSKEAVLREDLNVMRDAIDKFYGDTGTYPPSLDELVTRRYLRNVPVDPITESALTWQPLPPPDASGGGVYDVRSGAEGTTRDGVAFNAL